MKTLLVVDDDPDMRELLRRQLGGAGYDVVLAPDAGTARERIAERRPDLIVADIAMPGVSGVEMVAGLREHSALASIPVVYLTALSPESSLALKTLGFPVLSKPVVPAELLDAIAFQLGAQPRM